MGVLTGIFGGNGTAASEAASSDDTLKRLVLEVAALSDNEEIYQERIAELEFAIEDADWTQMGGMSSGFQFDRSTLDKIIHLSRLYYIKNPAIKRPVDLQAVYVWAQGVSIFSDVESIDDVVQAFLDDPSNRRSFSSSDSLMDQERRLRVDGNLFWRFFTNPTTGRVQVRKVPIDQVRAVVCNPEDRDEPWFYVRKFKKAGKDVTVAYPDWQYARQRKVDESSDEFGGRGGVQMVALADYPEALIEWETPVMHRKTGGFGDMDFGVPETYSSIDWARAYKELLEAYKKTINSLARWAWKMKAGGGQAQLNAAAAALGTTFGTTTDDLTETNPAPTAGSVWGYTGQSDMSPIDVSKAYVDPDGFRRVLLMVAAGMGMPEVYYGAAEGTFATAKAMDRPTELSFLARQAMWAEIIEDMVGIAVEAAARAPKYSGLTSAGYNDRGRMKLRAADKEVELEVEIDFPPILQKDVQAFLQALTTFTTQNGQAVQALNDGPTLYRIALTALGVDDVEEIIEVFYPKDGSKSTARPIETYEAPLSPQDVQDELADKLEKAQQAPPPGVGSPTGNQPTTQGAAGRANASTRSRGGPNAPSRQDSQGSEESQVRIEFMRQLMELRRELQEKKV